MLYEFILFLAILWILMNRREMDIILLILFAIGLYASTRNYPGTLLGVVILYGLYIDSIGYGFYGEGFENESSNKKLKNKKRKPIITFGKEKNNSNNKKEKKKSNNKNTKTIDITDSILKNPTKKPSEKYINHSAKALEEEITKNLRMDAGSTFLNAYKSLDPKQIENMKKDTVELIETQKVLMNTLSNITPVLENSQKMMSMFKNTFGSK
jgi:hypothetical protein